MIISRTPFRVSLFGGDAVEKVALGEDAGQLAVGVHDQHAVGLVLAHSDDSGRNPLVRAHRGQCPVHNKFRDRLLNSLHWCLVLVPSRSLPPGGTITLA